MGALASSPPSSSSLPHRSARRRLDVRGRRSPLDVLARLGHGAHGVVYMLVGALAARVAFLHQGKIAGPREAVSQGPALLANGALATALIAVIALGLLAYAAWRLGQAWFDPEGDASKKHGTLLRVAHALTGVAYLGFAAWTAKLAIGRGGSTGQQAPEWTARALAAPFGVFVVVAAGLIIIGLGVVAANKARRATFLKELDIASLKANQGKLVEGLGRAGYAARALVFGIIGAFLVVAAMQHDASQARGLGGALQALAAQPWGQLLLAATALGLVAFGAFEIARAITRRIVTNQGRSSSA